jgi:hypothetical protein
VDVRNNVESNLLKYPELDFNWFKKQYAGFYITDLMTIINKI